MSNQSVRLCMIGAGGHASKQMYPCFYQLKNVAIVANCDLDLERASRVGLQHGVSRQYSDWREMLNQEQPDGVMVCIGDTMHAQLAQDIMRAGYHVYVEKPHAPNAAASLAMLQCSEETGKLCMGAYKKRYTPAFLKAQQIYSQDSFGDICLVQAYRAMGGNDRQDGGFHWQWGCHIIDSMTWIGGPVQSVHAIKNKNDYRATCINLQYVSGAVGNLIMASPGGNWEEVRVLGSGMNAVSVKDGLSCTAYHGNDPSDGFTPSFAASGNSSDLQGFRGEMQAFIDAIQNAEKPEADISKIHHTAEIYEAIVRSLDSGAVEAVERAAEVLA